VLLALHEIWPEAPLYTAVYNHSKADWAKVFKIIPSYLQYIPLAKNHHQLLSLLTPAAFSRFDFSQYDIVISITSAEAKYIKVPNSVKHVCYCLTPTRYLWSQKYIYEKMGLKGKILKLSAPLSRMQDFEKVVKIDNIVSISTYVKKQIAKYYRRESEPIFPPVDFITQNKIIEPLIKDYYLVVSRLVSYKRIDLAIRACQELKRKLVIVGEGENKEELKRIAGDQIKFVGHLTDGELAGYYMHCKALLFPGIEDFGIVPLEAQFFGKAVIAYGKGGVLDTIINEKTGLFFYEQNSESLIQAILKFEQKHFDNQECKKNADKFNKTNFKQRIKKYIENIV